MLTCEGLSLAGWRHDSAAPEHGVAVLGGERVPVREIQAVFTRLFAVTESELPHILPEERAYVASEMNAFLLAWLSALRCPVFNRPTPLSLAGPSWSQQQWLCEAARAGLPIRARRCIARTFRAELAEGPMPAELAADEPASFSAAWVGVRCLPSNGAQAVDESIRRGMRRLAQAANVELLSASFVHQADGLRLSAASPWLDLEQAGVADALLAHWEASA
jgi:hypothetical protein